MSLIDGLENIQSIISYCEEVPDGVIILRDDYYKAKSVLEALKDIKLRESLGQDTRADGLLMNILAYSAYPPV